MQYISVKEIAAKFDVSERRVQQLCASGRIEGAQMISGVWVIPDSAEKPFDDRTVQPDRSEDLLSLSELCTMLSISAATGRNWLKLGKLIPQKTVGKAPFFSQEYADSFKASLSAGTNPALKSRRNKKYVSGSNIYNSYVSDSSSARKYVQQILDYIEANDIYIGNSEICTLVAECAVRLLLHDRAFAAAGSCLGAYLDGTIPLNGYDFLIDDLIRNRADSLDFIKKQPVLFQFPYQYEKGEDVLGLLYISTKNLGSRKATGSYYTPTQVVRTLCGKLFEKNTYVEKSILDPCCGTGNFLLQLPDEIPFGNIFANDRDELSVLIARINLAVKYSIADKSILYSHVTCKDYLNHPFSGTFDFIIGNPPWGYDYPEDEKKELRSKYSCAAGSGIESYDIFIEQAARDLALNGVLSFVLPEAILNAKMHKPIRNLLTQSWSFQYLNFLGNAFDKVQCPCIILQVKKTNESFRCIGMEVNDGQRIFRILTNRTISADCFSFLSTDEEYMILDKISESTGKCYLAGNAIFALGIVTGNNKEYITPEKNDSNELILKGSDLRKYTFHGSDHYIVFQPESFQQVAPTEYYRAPEKLLYRFICNQLIFAYDNRQTLSLNSCNLVIPQIEGLSVKYVLAILNSRIAQYYFKKTFHSVKVLRSHIEQIPIPRISKEQQEELLPYVETLLAAHDKKCKVKVYDELDAEISSLYGLTEKEYHIILRMSDN